MSMFYCKDCKKQTRHHWNDYANKFLCNQTYKHNEINRKAREDKKDIK